MSLTLTIAGGCIIGAMIHTLVKVNSINKRLCTTDYSTVFKEYWKTDWALFLLSMAGIAAAVFISSEWLNIQESDKTPATIAEILQYKIVQFAKTTSIVVGYSIDSIINAYLGGTEQKLIQKAKDAGLSMDDIVKVKAPKKDDNEEDSN